MKKMNSEKVYQVFIYLVVGLLVVASIFPLVYVVGMSLTSETEFLQRGNLMVIPHEPTLTGYRRILLATDTYVKGLGISVARVIIGTISNMLCNMILGYIISKKDFPGNKVLMCMVLVSILYNGGTIPTFLTVSGVGLLNSFWALIIPGLVDGWSVLVFRQFFGNIPKDVLESAEIDGCSELPKFVRIVLPMSKPALASLGLFSAVGHWNSWFDAAIYLGSRSEKYPLQLILRNLLINANLGADAAKDMVGIEVVQSSTSLRMVVVVVGTLPILCVYPFLQKYFTAGVYTGAVKE